MTKNMFDEPKQEAEKDDDDGETGEDNGPTENLLQPGSKISMEDF